MDLSCWFVGHRNGHQGAEMGHWMYGEFASNIPELKIEYTGKFSTTSLLISTCLFL